MPAFKVFKPIYVYHNDTVKSAKKKTVSKYYSLNPYINKIKKKSANRQHFSPKFCMKINKKRAFE